MAKEKKKHTKSLLYKMDGPKLKRDNKSCPKCGSGVFMAAHKDRQTCGRCSFTEMKTGGS